MSVCVHTCVYAPKPNQKHSCECFGENSAFHPCVWACPPWTSVCRCRAELQGQRTRHYVGCTRADATRPAPLPFSVSSQRGLLQGSVTACPCAHAKVSIAYWTVAGLCVLSVMTWCNVTLLRLYILTCKNSCNIFYTRLYTLFLIINNFFAF